MIKGKLKRKKEAGEGKKDEKVGKERESEK